ncbi:MAG: FtsX-like permease family protein [Gemmatimonadaceae bacterium]
MLPTWMELRVALRTLRRSKAFAAFSILALALAIAANTTMSSLIDGLIWPKMAFPEPGQLVVVHWTAPKAPLYPNVNIRQVLGDSGRTYSGATGWTDNGPYGTSIHVGNQSVEVPMEIVAGTFFRVVGARPVHGTLFTDSTAVARQVVVISERLWRALGARDRPFAPFAIELQAMMGLQTYTVIGVIADNGAIPTATDVYLPTRWNIGSEALLRLRHGVTQEQALAELNALAPNLDPAHSRFAHFLIQPAAATPGRNLGVVWALAAATLAVLIIACANIANLLLARGMARSRELATRLAFGASRLQVARLLFAESGLVALAGGVLGLFLSLWTIHLVSATLPAGLQYLGLVQPQLSWRVLVAGLGLTMVSAVVFGVAPAITLMRSDINKLLKGTGNRHSTGNRGRFQFLVVAEVAGALTLVVSASLLGAVAASIHLLDYGYDATNLIAAHVAEVPVNARQGFGATPGAALISRRRGELQRLREMPGVAAATAWWDPFLYGLVRVDDPGGGAPLTMIGTSRVMEVDPDYLRVMRIPILRGRNFHESEDDAIPSVIIDQATAHWLLPGADIVGRLISFANNGYRKVPWMRVVGITGPIVINPCGIFACPEHTFLIANGAGYPAPTASTTFIVRSKGPAQAFVTPLRAALASDYPGVTPGVATWGDVTGTAYQQSLYDFVTTLFGSFAFIGLLLALIGVYGMTAYAVEQRSREFGVRIALGAQTRDIIKMVLRQGNATALLGLAIGLLVANWVEQLLYGFLFGYDQMAPFFMAGAVVALFGATVLAGIPPALRASRVNPVDTLRSE